MPLAFSFFTSKRSSAAMPVDVAEVYSPVQDADFQGGSSFQSSFPKNPFPVPSAAEQPAAAPACDSPTMEDWQTAATLVLPTFQASPGTVLPEKKAPTQGLAAMVVRQSEKEAPPLNRRPPTSPFPVPAPESTGSLEGKETATALPAATLPAVEAGSPLNAREPSAATSSSSLALDPVRQELQEEIEQVKNDLFGAVMGVSALKDRLDGLEAQLTQMQAVKPAVPTVVTPTVSRTEVETWIQSWMETHLSVALERALAASQDQMLASLSTLAFFRAAAPLSGSGRQSFLAQPPVILTATPV